MARSLAIAAYLAGLGSHDRKTPFVQQPPRPKGSIIWARCCSPEQLIPIEALGRKLAEDGDPIHVVATLSDWAPEHIESALPEPRGRSDIRKFIAHWDPAMVIWVGGELDAILLSEMDDAHVPRIFANATADGLDRASGRWVPGARRSMLSPFQSILAIDPMNANRLIYAGAPAANVTATSPMGAGAPTPTSAESSRNDVATRIGPGLRWHVE